MKKTIGSAEKVLIINKKNKVIIDAKIDTGAKRSSISEEIAKKLGDFKIVGSKSFKSALFKGQVRPLFNLTYYMAGEKIETVVSCAKRKNLKYKMIIGRKDLDGKFLIDVSKRFTRDPR
jgi:hypothetical protein